MQHMQVLPRAGRAVRLVSSARTTKAQRWTRGRVARRDGRQLVWRMEATMTTTKYRENERCSRCGREILLGLVFVPDARDPREAPVTDPPLCVVCRREENKATNT